MKTKGEDLAAAAAGTVKSLVSRVPVLGEMLAGWDAYQSARFERETEFGEKSRICNQVKVVGRLKVSQGAYFDIGQRDTSTNFDSAARRQDNLR